RGRERRHVTHDRRGGAEQRNRERRARAFAETHLEIEQRPDRRTERGGTRLEREPMAELSRTVREEQGIAKRREQFLMLGGGDANRGQHRDRRDESVRDEHQVLPRAFERRTRDCGELEAAKVPQTLTATSRLARACVKRQGAIHHRTLLRKSVVA